MPILPLSFFTISSSHPGQNDVVLAIIFFLKKKENIKKKKKVVDVTTKAKPKVVD
jgi:hypothetical protein